MARKKGENASSGGGGSDKSGKSWTSRSPPRTVPPRPAWSSRSRRCGADVVRASSRTGGGGTLGEIAHQIEQLKALVYGIALVAVKDMRRGLRWRVFDLAAQTFFALLLPVALCGWGHDGWGGPLEPLGAGLRGYVKFDDVPYGTFYALWLAVALAVALCLANAAYVGYSFARHSFKFRFPLRFLRVLGHAQAGLYVPVLLVLLEPWDCPSLLPGAPHRSFGAELACWRGAHLPLALASLALLLCFAALCFSYNLLFFEADPHRPAVWAARPHARGELAAQAALTAAAVCVAISDVGPVARGLLLWMNQLRAAVAVVFVWVGLFVFAEGRYGEDLRRASSPAAFYGALLAGIPLAAGALWAFTGLHFRRRRCTGRAFNLAMTRAWHEKMRERRPRAGN
eukprot:tig00021319_g20213.t1